MHGEFSALVTGNFPHRLAVRMPQLMFSVVWRFVFFSSLVVSREMLSELFKLLQRWHPFEKYGENVACLGYCLATASQKILFFKVSACSLENRILP